LSLNWSEFTPNHPTVTLAVLQSVSPSNTHMKHTHTQYSNLYNAMAHYDTTGDEIVEQCQGMYILHCFVGASFQVM